MSGLVEVLAAHQRSVTREGGPCLCGEWPPSTFDVEWPRHLAAAILTHPREVAADEGVREQCLWAMREAGDVADVLDAFLDALGGTEASGQRDTL